MPGTFPAFAVQFAPGVPASTPPTAGQWVDISDRVPARWSCEWGRRDEFSESGAGTAELLIANPVGHMDPDNSAGPYHGQLVAGTWVRILGGTTAANTDVFYGHVSDRGFQLEASQFPDSFVSVDLVDDLEQLANTDMPESVWTLDVEADNPKARYRFGESSGTVASDSSGNGHHATYIGGVTLASRAGLVAGSSDTALEFDGVDDEVTLPYSAALTTLPFTVEFWMQTPTIGTQDRVVFEHAPLAPGATVQVLVLNSNDFVFLGRIVFTAAGTVQTSSIRVDDDEPHHVVCSRSAAGDVKIYIDGVDRSAGVRNSTNLPGYGSTRIGSGEYFTIEPSFFEGVLDEFAIYETALSTARIAAHYEAGTAPWQGDTTGERIGKLLDAVGYDATLRNIDTGSSTLQATTLGGGDALSAIRDAAKAEAGFVYIDHQDGGKLRFVGRRHRWTDAESVTSQATLGDAGAEVTYDAVMLEDDRVFNRATVQRANGAAVTVSDPVSEASRRRTLNESGLLFESDAESQYRAERIVAEKKDRHRVPRSVTLRPRKSTHPAWLHVFARRVDDRVVVRWRPPYGGLGSWSAWVDGISHRWDVDTGLDTTFYLSPVPFDVVGTPYGVWGTSTWETGDSVFRWGY